MNYLEAHRPHSLVRIILGDALESLRTIADGTVQCCVTSPPYWGLRDYGVVGQIGLEDTPEEWLQKLVEVFREVRRVLRSDGTLWLNVGDAYSGGARRGNTGRANAIQNRNKGSLGVRSVQRRPKDTSRKQLLGLPWRLAFALQADGWILRSDNIFHKLQAMPESVQDRPTRDHEYVFLFAKSEKYYYDMDAVSVPASPNTHSRGKGIHPKMAKPGEGTRDNESFQAAVKDIVDRRNLRTVWSMKSRPYHGAHFAVFPPELAETCILASTSAQGACFACEAPWRRIITIEGATARSHILTKDETASARAYGSAPQGLSHQEVHKAQYRRRVTVGWKQSCKCSEKGVRPCVVLDPFAGSGTVGQVARVHGRRAVLIELSQKSVDLAVKRVLDDMVPKKSSKPPKPSESTRSAQPSLF